jgi:hypothetical protein
MTKITIRTVIEFISTQSLYDQIFPHHTTDEMINNYQMNSMVESDVVCELFLKPYTFQCVQYKRQLKLVFTHRPKTVVSLTRCYKVRKR